jgi:hypothetical protein
LLGDEDSAALELQAARGTFAELGAKPDLAALEALAPTKDPGDAHGLSLREREVLRLVVCPGWCDPPRRQPLGP